MAHPWSGADARPESWSGTVLPGGATTYYRLHRLFQRGAMTRQAVDTLLAEENSNEPLSPNDVDAIMGMLDTRFGDAEVWAPGLIVEVEPSPLEERAAARAAMDEMGVPELSVAEKASFDRDGCILLKQVITPEQTEAIRARCAELLAAEGIEAGREVHQEAGAPRLAALHHKGEEFDEVCFNTRLLSAAAYALDGDVCCNSYLAYRDAVKGRGQQALHSDGPCCPVPGPPGERFPWHSLGCILLLDRFTETNGR